MSGVPLVLFLGWLHGRRWHWAAPQDPSVVLQREWSADSQVGPELAVQEMTKKNFIPLSVEENRSLPVVILKFFPSSTWKSPCNVQSLILSTFSIIWSVACTDRCSRGCFWSQDKSPVSQLHQTRIFLTYLFTPSVFSSMSWQHTEEWYIWWGCSIFSVEE